MVGWKTRLDPFPLNISPTFQGRAVKNLGGVNLHHLQVFCLKPPGVSRSLLNNLGGGFKYVLFSSLLGEMIQFDEHIFQMGWFNHQLVIHSAITFLYLVFFCNCQKKHATFLRASGIFGVSCRFPPKNGAGRFVWW